MTIPPEHPLTGGNATDGVVRVEETVRKPWQPSTPGVHELLRAMTAAGVEVPAPLGRDEQGRQILEFIPGPLAMDLSPLTPDELARVGALVRSIHEASASFTPSAPTTWDPLLPTPASDLLCHNDLAPWNLIAGERWVFIDWDGAGPSTRLWDLAYSAQAFTLNDVEVDPDDAAAGLAAFVGGYDADGELRESLPRAMARRTTAMFELLETSYHDGRDPWGTMFLEGHGEHWRRAADYVAQHEAIWHRALQR